MDSNHGNLYNEILDLVIGHYVGIHTRVNGMTMEVGVGDRSRIKQSIWYGRNRTGDMGEGRVRHEKEWAEGEGMEIRKTLVGDVQEYRNFYMEGGVDDNPV